MASVAKSIFHINMKNARKSTLIKYNSLQSEHFPLTITMWLSVFHSFVISVTERGKDPQEDDVHQYAQSIQYQKLRKIMQLYPISTSKCLLFF